MFKELVGRLGLELTDKQEEQFRLYFERLVKVNEYMNLTAITEKTEVYIKHFYDSLTMGKVLLPDDVTLCDVGSGAGFPSVPLAIMYPQLLVTIIDALNKRISFLNELIEELELNNVCAIHARAEDFVKEKRSSFDVVCARAVANLPVLCELCMPLVKVGGHFVAMKGSNSNAKSEMEKAKNAIKELGGTVERVMELQLPKEMGDRSIICINKDRVTPLKYPRAFKVIKEKPL